VVFITERISIGNFPSATIVSPKILEKMDNNCKGIYGDICVMIYAKGYLRIVSESFSFFV
jgi:hypothetical protein